MAQSYWLTQRALRFQNDCFQVDGVDQKQLALFLRYQTTHQRAFYKAFDALLRLKKEATRAQPGFVSQRPSKPEEFVRQNTSAFGFVSQNAPPIAEAHHFPRQNTPESQPNPGAEGQIQAA